MQRISAKRGRPRKVPTAPIRAPLREDARAFKRETIVNAAIEIFYRKGYQTATMDDVAASMSVTKAAVYYYFETKESLLEAIIDRCSDLTLKAVERGVASGDTPPKRFALASFCLAAMVLENRELVAIYFREERNFPMGLRERVTRVEKAVTIKLSKVIEAGIRARNFRHCDARLLALSVESMISMSFYWYAEHGHAPKVDLCRHFAEEALYMAGFKDDVALDRWLRELPAA